MPSAILLTVSEAADKLNVSLGNRSVHIGQNVILNGWYDGNMFVVGGRDGK